MNTTNEKPKKVFTKIMCDCGVEYFKQNLFNHCKTKIHQGFLKNEPYIKPCKNFDKRKEFLDEETLIKRRNYINDRYNRLYSRKRTLPEGSLLTL